MRILSAILLSLSILAAGCNSGGGEPDEQASPTEAAAGDSGSAGAGEGGGDVVLQAGSLEAGRKRLTFGKADAKGAVKALKDSLGKPTEEQKAQDCGPGPLYTVRWKGLTTYYSEGTLEGWYLDKPVPGAVKGPKGVGPGTKLGDLRAKFGKVKVDETNLGFEWSAGGVFGTLTADSDHDTVVQMWSGANCIAR
jgi:hypothetical protein